MENLILVNKTHSIDINYVPNDLTPCDSDQSAKMHYGSYLRQEPYHSVVKLRREARCFGYDIYVYSGFRSGAQQQRTFENFLEKNISDLISKGYSDDLEELKRRAYILTTQQVAKPGQSEHQTGLAMDIACFYKDNYEEDISNDEEVEWMHENAHKYGFILRYPRGFEEITGYKFEPWHYRYVGEEYATDIVNKKLTYEDYYTKVLRLG